MKAVVSRRYGSPDVLQFEEVPKPTPGDDEVLVKVHAASVNPLDYHFLRGSPFFLRLAGNGLLRPKNIILGADVAGRVERIGGNVSRFQPGDEVFGDISQSGMGAFAEYVCAREDLLAKKPAAGSFEQAAAAPVAALTALQGLRQKGRVQSGQKVLIHGASGGVGSFAVQIAKSLGAEVTGVCSTRNLDAVRSMGADHAIDYTKEDFSKNGELYDLIFAVNGFRSIFDYKRALTPQGIYVCAGGSAVQLFQAMVIGPWLSMTGNNQMGVIVAKQNKQDLETIAGFLATGEVLPVIDRRYPLREVADAIRYLEEGHARGKIVITM